MSRRLLLVGLLLAAVEVAAAQPVPLVTPGDRVRVRPGRGPTIEGRVERVLFDLTLPSTPGRSR